MKRNLDVDAFYGALESKKSELGVSWRGLAAELELPDHTVFTRMSRGQTPDVDTLLSLSAWLGVPLETYAHGEVAAPDSRSRTLESIRSFLRADEALSERAPRRSRRCCERPTTSSPSARRSWPRSR